MHDFGRLVLNKTPENHHRYVEQAAFSPGSMVPGIEDSPDPLLQFCMSFYRDAQYHHVGVNVHQIPVVCPSMAGKFNFDDQMRVDADHAGNKQCTPNSFVNKSRRDTAEAPCAISDNTVSRKWHYAHEGKKSEDAQATELDEARQYTHQNTAKMMVHIKEPIIQVIHFESLPLLIRRLTSVLEEVPGVNLQHRSRVPQSRLRSSPKEALRIL